MSNSLAVYQLSVSANSAGAQITWYDPNTISPIFTAGSDGWVTKAGGNGQPSLVVSKPNGSPATSTAIDIKVLDITGSTYFNLCGIVIRRSGNSGNPQGRDSFPASVISADRKTLTLTDNDSVKTSYELDVLFMDSAENYGLLDPKIQNN